MELIHTYQQLAQFQNPTPAALKRVTLRCGCGRVNNNLNVSMYFYFILSVNIIGEMYDELHVLFALMYNLRNALCAHTHRSGPPKSCAFYHYIWLQLLVHSGNKQTATRKVCSARINNAGSTTSNLIRHLKTHPDGSVTCYFERDIKLIRIYRHR